MGKGDKKSARGKRFMGSYGNSRRRADNKKAAGLGKAPVAVAAATEDKKKPTARKKAE